MNIIEPTVKKTSIPHFIVIGSMFLEPTPIKKFAIPIAIAAIIAIYTPFSIRIFFSKFNLFNDTNVKETIRRITKINWNKLSFSPSKKNANNADETISSDQIGSTTSNLPFLRASRSKKEAKNTLHLQLKKCLSRMWRDFLHFSRQKELKQQLQSK